MKRYWQFAIVGIICLLVALLWSQPQRSQAPASQALTVALLGPAAQPSRSAASPGSKPAASTNNASGHPNSPNNNDDQPLPGSSSSLPLLAVIGFGVLAGGITSAMRTR